MMDENISLQFSPAIPALQSARLFDRKHAIGTLPIRRNGGRMKKQGHILSRMILGMFLVLAVGMAHAQMGGDVLEVKIPFNFRVGPQEFAAGEYSLKPLLPHTMLLRNRAGQVLTSMATNSVESIEIQRSVKLVFNGYGGRYFLAQIWRADDNVGGELIKSSAEIEMARKHSPGQQIALRVVAHR
jgi:hypothetical protein